ncbi:MAG: 4Fe-4S binding protein, partial [Clostridiaceae bacterium]|nr:4Fe-4S binding protein [Clostridiaceae bacterium]
MKDIKTKYFRILVQASIFLILIIMITLYNLYINEIIDFKFLGIGDLNPYGGWNALREFATDSSYVFEGISNSMVLTIALVAIAILGGRFFCGWLCPIGATQDFASWLGSKTNISKYNRLSNNGFNPLLLKYPVLLALLILSILGYGAMIAELSPWRALMNLPKITSAWSEMEIGFIILAGIFLASIFLSRFFCRYLCPLGAAQALFSSFSPLSLKHSKDCSQCNKCFNECPVGIRLSSGSDTISPECIRCMNCVENCKVSKNNGIRLKIGNRNVSIIAYVILMLVLF